jgi:cold shock CspA family protein
MFDDLKVGDKVSFEVVDTEKGPAAQNVKRV